MKLPSFDRWMYVARTLRSHLLRFCWLYGAVAFGFVWVQAHYRIAVNMTESLPNTLFLVALGEKPTMAGEYVAFEWRRNSFYAPGWMFVKRIAGVPGQTISVNNRTVFVDDHRVGYAKPYSKRGIPLEPIQSGVIPAGYLYAEAPHPDSLDSRYQVTGLIESDRIMGKAYAIF